MIHGSILIITCFCKTADMIKIAAQRPADRANRSKSLSLTLRSITLILSVFSHGMEEGPPMGDCQQNPKLGY